MASEDIGSLVVRLEANAKNLLDGIDRVGDRLNKAESGFVKFGKVVAGAFAFGAVVSFGKKLIDTAANAEEMQSKFDVVFGKMSKDAEDWAKNFKDKVGGSRVEIKGMLADSQDLLTGFGATTDQAFDFSTKMQALGTDLASFQNLQGGSAEAVDRLRKGLLGETENLKAMGIVINETIMQQAMVAKGDNRKIKDLSELEKIQLRYEIAVSQSKNAIGDAERTSGSYTNQMRKLKGELNDASAALGVKLLPKMTEFVVFLNTKLPEVEAFINKGVNAMGAAYKFVTDNANILIPVVTGLTAAIVAQSIIGGITTLYKAWQAATVAQTTVQWLLNAALNANPIGLVALAIGGLIAIGVALWKNWDWVKEKALALWQTLKNNPLYALVAGPIGALIAAGITIANNWDSIKAKAIQVFGTLRDFVGGVAASISGSFRGMVNGVISAFNFMIRALNRLRFTVPDWVPKIGGQGFGFNLRELPGFATGVQNFRGGMALVGERGPELVNLPRGSDVIPADKTRQALGGQTITNTFVIENMNVRSDNDVKMLARELFNLQKSRARGSGAVAT